MYKVITYSLFFLIVIFIMIQLFIYSSVVISDDDLHHDNFVDRYGIFSLNQPSFLDFAGEEVPVYSDDIWERFDKEILKNTYWQSNTLLYICLLYTSPSPRDGLLSRMPSSA